MVITVMLMLDVPTLLGASPAPVTKDTVGMGSTVLVSSLSSSHAMLNIIILY